MSAGPAPAPVTTVAGVVARMELIQDSLPAADGLACFNRMYLDVTRRVVGELHTGYYADPAFMTKLDVAFANLYFDAVDAASDPITVPLAWRPLIEDRDVPGIEPIQFALAGMNAHINHDLPIAVVETCVALGTSPTSDSHPADYQKVDRLLDAAEEAIRQSFETGTLLAVDRHLQAVDNLIANWTINSARDLAWTNSLVLWQLRDDPSGYQLFADSLAATAALASRLLLVAV